MINCDEMIKVYWNQYIALEREFSDTLKYVTLAEENYSVYSDMYIKIMLQIGSEVDIALKLYCQMLDQQFQGRTINAYRNAIQKSKPEFCTQFVQIIPSNVSVQPWINWDKPHDSAANPYWWVAYNKIKHDRTGRAKIGLETKECYKFGNLQNVIQGLAGLYQILIYYYYTTAELERKRVLTPLPGSRMFRLVGGHWSDVNFYGDYAFYVNESGHLLMEYGKPYF